MGEEDSIRAAAECGTRTGGGAPSVLRDRGLSAGIGRGRGAGEEAFREEVMFTTYLNFNGNCGEAFRFYERCFGGKIEFMQTFGESAMKDSVPPNQYDLVMHVALKVDG